jgi:predicted dithiol-disulfide oxidoreductase (DUF899 family)
MALPEVVSREQWLKARLALLAEEKELTRRRDALNAVRPGLGTRRARYARSTRASSPRRSSHGCALATRRSPWYARPPLVKIEDYTAGQGWVVPWYSSHGSDFNYDFQVTLDKDRPQLDYNYRSEPGALGDADTTELPGMSCFLRDGEQIYHTYSTFARGTDGLGGSYSLLDLTAMGR